MLVPGIESLVFIFLGTISALCAIFFINVIWRLSGSGRERLANAQKYSTLKSGEKAGIIAVIKGRIDSRRNSRPDFAVQRSMSFTKDGQIIPQGRVSDEVIDNIFRK